MAPARSSATLLAVLLLAGASHTLANSSACLNVPAASSDTSASSVQFVKANTVRDAVCPGWTFTVALTFPTARTWQVVSTKGAFQGATGTCTNQVAGTTAVKSVTNLKLHLGCAATGSVKVSVLSKGAGDTGMLLKTVSKPIKALKDCPDSPCFQAAAPTPASSPAPAQANANAGMPNMTGNPMVDMMSVFSMMYGTSGVANTPLGLVLNANTAMTVISGLSTMNTNSVQAVGAIKTIQGLLNMVPATENNAFVGGMKNFLNVVTTFLPTGAATDTIQQQMSKNVLDVVSAMAGMAGIAATGNANPLAAALPMLKMMNSMSSLMSLLPMMGATPVIGAPGVAAGVIGAPGVAAGEPTPNAPPAGSESGPATTTPPAETTTPAPGVAAGEPTPNAPPAGSESGPATTTPPAETTTPAHDATTTAPDDTTPTAETTTPEPDTTTTAPDSTTTDTTTDAPTEDTPTEDTAADTTTP